MVPAAPSTSLWGLFRVLKMFFECILSPTPGMQLERFFFRLPAKSKMWREGSVGVLILCVSVLWLLCFSQLPMAFCCPVKDLGESKCLAVSDAHTFYSPIPRGLSFLRLCLFHCLLQSFQCSHLPLLLPPGWEWWSEAGSHSHCHLFLLMFQV